MTDPLLKEEQETSENAKRPESVGVGGTLRAIRVSRRISLSEASQRLKYSVRQIESLEAEEWSNLPEGMPLRGFVRNYARYLEADVDSVLVLLDNAVGSTKPPRVVVAPGVSGSSVPGDEVPMAAESTGRPWGWFIIILAILVIAAFY